MCCSWTSVQNPYCVSDLTALSSTGGHYLFLREGGVREPTARYYVALLLFLYADSQVC